MNPWVLVGQRETSAAIDPISLGGAFREARGRAPGHSSQAARDSSAMRTSPRGLRGAKSAFFRPAPFGFGEPGFFRKKRLRGAKMSQQAPWLFGTLKWKTSRGVTHLTSLCG